MAALGRGAKLLAGRSLSRPPTETAWINVISGQKRPLVEQRRGGASIGCNDPSEWLHFAGMVVLQSLRKARGQFKLCLGQNSYSKYGNIG